MSKKQNGFSTPYAITVIFSLSVLVMALSSFVFTSQKKLISYEKYASDIKDINNLISEIETELQGLKDVECDTCDNYEIEGLLNCLIGYKYSIFDVSTGIKRNFIGNKVFSDKAFKNYFLTHDETTEPLYTWINPHFVDEGFIEDLKKEHARDNLFPLVNEYPLMNIYRMNDDLIKIILDFYKIKDSERKVLELKGILGREIEIKDIARLLEISENHPFFDLVGTKTTFYELDFEKDGYEIQTIFAAVPDKKEKRKIARYMLIDKTIMKKRFTA